MLAILAPLAIATRPPSPPGPSASAVAGATETAPSKTAAPSASADPWEPLALLPFTPVASLVATAGDAAGVRAETAFTLASLTGEPASKLAERLEVSPATRLKVAPGADAQHVALTPEGRLDPGAQYRFTLRATGGTLAGSWAFRVRGPLRVLGTLPADRRTNVPVDTGIEVTFDQEDAADLAGYFMIDPATEGRFERHGRTQVFVPSSLRGSTVYTVTIKAGLPRTGTDLKLERDAVFRFETAGPEAQPMRWVAGRDVLEASPSEAPALAIVALGSYDEKGDPRPTPTTADVKVYRYPSRDAATSALQAFLAAPRWAEYSNPVLSTNGLTLHTSFTATLATLPSRWEEESHNRVVQFPAALPKGWYAVEIAGARPAYVFLQVTPISAWVSVLKDRTVLWVNDVVAHRAIAGATVALPGAASFATSGDDGIANGKTPAELLPAAVAPGDAPAPPVLIVRAGADSLLIAFDANTEDAYRGEWWEEQASGDESYWSLLFTDRSAYRTTDTVAAWGYLRSREGNGVPASVDVRLRPMASTIDGAPAIAAGSVKPDDVGTYTIQLKLDRAPLGSYVLEAVADGRVVASRWLDVTVIHKPEYQLSVVQDHRAVLSGATVRLTATTTFFDGTPAAGIPLHLYAEQDRDFGPTGAAGTARVSTVATSGEGAAHGDVTYSGMDVAPRGPESGELWANTDVLVFPASEYLRASGSVSNGRLHVTADLRNVDLAAVERQLAKGSWEGDPGGGPIAGRRVSVTVTDLVPVRTKTGTRYDYIEKVVVPLYHYEISRNALTSTSIVSAPDGRLVLDIAVPAADHQYEVAFRTQDSKHRAVLRTVDVGRDAPADAWTDQVVFSRANGTVEPEVPYALGEEIVWTMASNGKPLPSGATDRYLYIVAQRGLASVVTTASPTFRRTFAASDAPGIFVIGVRFTGTTYAPKAASWANFDESTRRITVTVQSDRERYRPGQDIRLTVRTASGAGKPVAADVVVQAVDEKLYAMGFAGTPDPLGVLYQRVDSGIVRLTSTHQVPTASGPEGEGGDTGGDGGPRTDFRDMLAFLRIRTNADGIATTTIKASDDITAWHVSASAMTRDLRAGVGEALVQVGLPLFASVTTADEYLVTDQPAIRLRAFGLNLRAGDPVTFTVASAGLGLAPTTLKSTAFADTWLTLPPLRLGRQSVDVTLVAPTRKDAAGKPLRDRLVAMFDVTGGRLTVPHARFGGLDDVRGAIPSSVDATYTFTDAGRARYAAILLDLAGSTSLRLDSGIAGTMARDLLDSAFGRDPATLPPDAFDISRYEIAGPVETGTGVVIEDWQQIGIALLPSGGIDPWLAARVAIAHPGIARSGELRYLLGAIRDDISLPRDLRVAAVAGLASLGEAVFADVAALRAEANLTTFEQLNVGLAAAAVGDLATAREIERALLSAHGQQLGPWVRLNASSSRNGMAELTALCAMLAARVGDPIAARMLDYTLANPSMETSHGLDTAATVAALLDWTPASTASLAMTVDGKRRVVDIPAGASVAVALTAAQRSTLSLEPLSGEVGVAVAWRAPMEPGAVHADETITLSRRAPAVVPTDRLVVVNLQATFTNAALDSGCYAVVEQVPSGLVPLQGAVGQQLVEGSGIIWPSRVVGQEVSFCVPWASADLRPTANLQYVARAVSTGTFTWEPAIMSLEGAPDVITLTEGSTVKIGG